MSLDDYFRFFLSDDGKCTLCNTQLFDDECSNCGASQIAIADTRVLHLEEFSEVRISDYDDRSLKARISWYFYAIKSSKLVSRHSEELWALTKPEYQESLMGIARKQKMRGQPSMRSSSKSVRQSKPEIPLLLELAAMKRARVPWYFNSDKVIWFVIVLLLLLCGLLSLIESI